jgi:hypothetical protein
MWPGSCRAQQLAGCGRNARDRRFSALAVAVAVATGNNRNSTHFERRFRRAGRAVTCVVLRTPSYFSGRAVHWTCLMGEKRWTPSCSFKLGNEVESLTPEAFLDGKVCQQTYVKLPYRALKSL